MKHLDITLDFETAALCPTAAPLSIGAVAWNRYAKETPFLDTNAFVSEWFANIDLSSCFVAGLTIDTQTQEWWKKQSEMAKNALIEGNKLTIKDTITELFEWIEEVRKAVGAKTVCLWSQGSDFDIAILRNICYIMNIKIPVHYTNFRDHRSVVMELASTLLEEPDSEVCIPALDPSQAYTLVEQYKDGTPHTPIYDCKKSIYSTWQLMRQL